MKDPKTSKRSAVHWRAPTTIVLAFAFGVAFAAGHHIFYNSLDGHVAPTETYRLLGSNVSQQQINIAIGTAFAFLVSAMLVMSVSVAYVQILWRAILNPSKPLSLSKLDTLSSGISSLWSFLQIGAFWRNPSLYLFATLAWLIPIASVITPATLSIDTGFTTRKLLKDVPNLQWASLNYVNDMVRDTYGGPSQPVPESYWVFNGPSTSVSAIGNEVASTGSILGIQAPEVNSSYTLSFAGPALSCSESSDTAITKNIALAMRSTPCTAYGYVSWTAGLPFVQRGNGSNLSYEISSESFQNKAMSMTLYLAALPHMMDFGHSYYQEPQACALTDGGFAQLLQQASVVECKLVNSTYDVSFNFTDGLQTVNSTTTPIKMEAIESVSTVSEQDVYCGEYNDRYDTITVCELDLNAIIRLSYTGIMDAFNRLLTGSIYVPYLNSSVGYADSSTADSSITETVLVQTPGLQYLTKLSPTLSLKDLVKNGQMVKGLVTSTIPNSDASLPDMLEKLFENITISLMSSNELRPNLTSELAPPQAEVTVHAYHTFYSYSAMKLWIAYGLAIFFTMLAALSGLLAIAIKGASFSYSFSPILRIARGTEIEVKEDDLDGKDPLPKYLKKEKVAVRRKRAVSEPSQRTQGLDEQDVESVHANPSSQLLPRQTW